MKSYTFVADCSDRRNEYLKEYLAAEGYRTESYKAGAAYAEAGARVFMLAPAAAVTAETAASIPDGSILFCFKCEAKIADELFRRGVRIFYYFDDELLAMRNAYLTAEGALGYIIQNTEISLRNMRALILGGGRVGKATAKLLHDNRCFVSVATDDKAEYAFASIFADEVYRLCEFCDHLLCFSVIVNTIPALVLKGEMLKKISPDCFLLDLASKPGGIDFFEAEALGLKTVHALGIPGKTAPKTAGENIKNSVLDILFGL